VLLQLLPLHKKLKPLQLLLLHKPKQLQVHLLLFKLLHHLKLKLLNQFKKMPQLPQFLSLKEPEMNKDNHLAK
jgi:hypothetical protein